MVRLETRNLDNRQIHGPLALELETAFQQEARLIGDAVERIMRRKDDPAAMLGWIDLPSGEALPQAVHAYRRGIPPQFTDVLVLGIGGSALGTRAIDQALGAFGHDDSKSRLRLHIVDNVDSDTLNETLRPLDPRHTLVNVISKSGTTAETMAAFLIVDAWLERKLGEGRQEHIVVTTDPESGILRPYAEKSGITTFGVPPSVGGRFSVFSAVGLVPLALRGIAVDGLLEGARAATDDLLSPFDRSVTQQMAAAHVCMAARGASINVFMPYSSRLRQLSDWFVQLWAESLGKALDRDGNEVHRGTTPLPATGTTDQHAQVQLFNEGPHDKLVTFIDIEEPDADLVIPHPPEALAEVAYLAGKPLHALMRAERAATAHALAQHGRPSLTLYLPRLDAFHLGFVMQSLMWQTAIVGERWNINAFDQPGVELAKRYTYALMGRDGYESLRSELVGQGILEESVSS